MSREAFRPHDLLAMIGRNLRVVLLSLLLGVLGAYAAILYLPPKYKSKCVLNIQPSYFQNALLGNILPQVYDPGEQNAQRISLLRLALSESFLDTLGEKYSRYKYPADHPMRLLERVALLNSIEYFSVNTTSFQVAVIAQEAQDAHRMLNEVLERMIVTLIDERRHNLMTMREAIEGRIHALTPGLLDRDEPVSSVEQETMQKELIKLQARIAVLKSQFTERHPDVLRLQERERLLKRMLVNPAPTPIPVAPEDQVMSPVSRRATQEVLDDLIKKLNYLDVVLDTESKRDNVRYLSVVERPSLPAAPFFPPRSKFMVLGFGVGLILAAALIVYLELRRGTFMAPENVAESFGVPLLGELPRMPKSVQLKMFKGPGSGAVRQLLPPPTRSSEGEA